MQKSPGDKVVMLDMNEERKERFKRVANEVMEVCKKDLTPIETFALLRFCEQLLAQMYGIKDSQMYGDLGAPQ